MGVEPTLYSLEGCCFIQLSYSTITYSSECPLDMTVEDIDEVINYFENTEEYENCMQLVYVKNDKIGELLTKKLMRDAL